MNQSPNVEKNAWFFHTGDSINIPGCFLVASAFRNEQTNYKEQKAQKDACSFSKVLPAERDPGDLAEICIMSRRDRDKLRRVLRPDEAAPAELFVFARRVFAQRLHLLLLGIHLSVDCKALKRARVDYSARGACQTALAAARFNRHLVCINSESNATASDTSATIFSLFC
jgi:hypothetical protein